MNARDPLLPSPSEPEELAAELRALPSHYRYFSDTLNADDYYRMVAEALIARGYSKRSSPSSSEPVPTRWFVIARRDRAWIPVEGSERDTDREARDYATKLSIEDADGGPFSICASYRPTAPLATSSPSSAGQEVREAVRDVLTELADECKVEYFQNFITKYGVRAAIKSFRDEQYPALSAGETETRT